MKRLTLLALCLPLMACSQSSEKTDTTEQNTTESADNNGEQPPAKTAESMAMSVATISIDRVP